MKLIHLIEPTRSYMRPVDAFWAVIEIAASRIRGEGPVNGLRCDEMIPDAAVRVLLEGAAGILVKEGRQARYDAIMEFLEEYSHREKLDGFWLRNDASDCHLVPVIRHLEDVRRVRFFFASAFRPWLTYAFDASNGSNSIDVHFSTAGDLALKHACHDLINLLELEGVHVDDRSPWEAEMLMEADLEVLFPPFGMTIKNTDEVSPRILARVGASSARAVRLSAETLSIAYALERPAGQAIICVPEGELFRMVGAEAVIRRDLVESGRLRCVISVPPGLYYTSTMVRFGVLVLSGVNHPHSTVRFVDMGHEYLTYRGTRGRYEFNEDVYETDIIFGQPPFDPKLARDVPRDEILQQNSVLTPDRYLNTGPKERIDALMRQNKMTTLPDVVELIRPINLQKGLDEIYTIREASPGDVGGRGYLECPGRSFTVDRATYNRALNQQVRPGDVLLSIKGTIGTVGLVPDDVPTGDGQEIWTAGQSLMILRPGKRGHMDPVVLYEYLTNETVQEFIQSLAGGVAVQGIAMRDLKTFPVPIPEPEVMEEVRMRFHDRQALFDQIDDLKAKIETIRAQHWPHADLNSRV